METFSIVDNINVNLLNKRIAEFIYKEGYEPYIFANMETLEALVKPFEQVEMFMNSCETGLVSSYKGYICGIYQGNKMFNDDTLKFGEIELR